jgi:cell division protein DivIC
MGKSSRSISPSQKGSQRRMKLVFFFLLLFFAWATLTFWGQMGKLETKQQQVDELEAELAATKKENSEAKREIERLNDTEYIEQIARKDFFMTKPGEILFVTPQPRD